MELGVAEERKKPPAAFGYPYLRSRRVHRVTLKAQLRLPYHHYSFLFSLKVLGRLSPGPSSLASPIFWAQRPSTMAPTAGRFPPRYT